MRAVESTKKPEPTNRGGPLTQRAPIATTARCHAGTAPSPNVERPRARPPQEPLSAAVAARTSASPFSAADGVFAGAPSVDEEDAEDDDESWGEDEGMVCAALIAARGPPARWQRPALARAIAERAMRAPAAQTMAAARANIPTERSTTTTVTAPEGDGGENASDREMTTMGGIGAGG